MWKRFFAPEPLPLGLAWEEDGLRIVEIGSRRQGYRVKALYFPFPEALVETGCEITHRMMVEFLKKIVAENRWHKRTVVTALPPDQVMIRNLKFPPMSREDLHQAVAWEVRQLLNGELSAYTYDYMVTDEQPPSGESGEVHVMIAAMEREKVMAYYHLFCQAGFQLQAIDVIPLALKRALLGDIQGSGGEMPVVLLNLGNRFSQLAVIDQGQLTLARSLPCVLEFGQDRDLAVRKQSCLPSKLVQEIRKTMDFFQAEHRRPVTGIIASGAALSPLILQKLKLDLGIQVVPGLPGNGLPLDRYPEPSYAVAMGLALKGVRD